MDTKLDFGPIEDRSWDQDVILAWTQERWPTRRGWALALALVSSIPALFLLPPWSFVVFGLPAILGLANTILGKGPLITPAGETQLRLSPNKLTYDVIADGRQAARFEMARADAAKLQRRLMDKADTAITVLSRDGRALELGDRRLEPRIEGRQMLLSTWLASWWPDETSWQETAGPGGMVFLDPERSQRSPQALRMHATTVRSARLALVCVLTFVAWIFLLYRVEDDLLPHVRFIEAGMDLLSWIGMAALLAAGFVLLWPSLMSLRGVRPAQIRSQPARSHRPAPRVRLAQESELENTASISTPSVT